MTTKKAKDFKKKCNKTNEKIKIFSCFMEFQDLKLFA
jgi:hypothetical protein